MNKQDVKQIIREAVEELKKDTSKSKVTRESFVYLEPKGDGKTFAQCATCRMWTGKESNTCSILGKTKVTGDMSCNLYVYGKPSPGLSGKEIASYTSKEVGLVKRQVRCENCRSFQNGTCLLYQTLNKQVPDIFNLNEKVSPQGCCNAQIPKSG